MARLGPHATNDESSTVEVRARTTCGKSETPEATLHMHKDCATYGASTASYFSESLDRLARTAKGSALQRRIPLKTLRMSVDGKICMHSRLLCSLLPV